MFQGTTMKMVLIASVAALSVVVLTGCGATNTTARGDLEANRSTLLADAGLGAGDSLGAQVFNEQIGGQITTVAILQEAEMAFAIADAHEADGTYDAWYASFDRPGEDGTAIAGASDEPSPAPATVVGVEVPLDDE